MDQKRARTYLMYALGEILLVVIGILIALQVNNWNQLNTEQKISIEYHERMISDIDQMAERLEAEIERAEAISRNLTDAVMILEKQEFNDSTKTVLDQAMFRFFQLSSASYQISSYEEMKSTGKLNLIYNVELRQKLNGYSTYASVISGITDQFSVSVNGSFDLFNQYIRMYVGDGPDHQIKYDEVAISENPDMINTLSKFSYDWDSYTYFLGVIVNQMKGIRQDLELELNTMQNS